MKSDPEVETIRPTGLWKTYRGGSVLEPKTGLKWGKKPFLRFSKNGQITNTRNSGGKRQKHTKKTNFVHLKISHKMCSDVSNQSRMGLALHRTRFDHYFEKFGKKV